MTFLFHTVGELCFSPVTLAVITRLSPMRLQSKMMGLYFAMTGIGGKLAATLGEYSTLLGVNTLFIAITLSCFLLGVIILHWEPTFQKMMHEQNTTNQASHIEKHE